jgi:hypothetical protein
MMNCNHFQLVMLAYSLNCWLMLGPEFCMEHREVLGEA